MRIFLQRFFGSGIFAKRCMTKCPNCTNGACSRDVGHTSFHYCNYEEKEFG
jgi:hypothetical protein